jgi:diamine N-acetyltransferase
MKLLKGTSIYLRKAEVTDAELVLSWENMPEFWAISESPGPYELVDMQLTLQQSYDLVACGQVRWIIFTSAGVPLGLIDLFNYEASSQEAGIGIMIGSKLHRNQGYGKEAVALIIQYCRQKKLVRKLKCLIHCDNLASIGLFIHFGFQPKRQIIYKGKPAINYELSM